MPIIVAAWDIGVLRQVDRPITTNAPTQPLEAFGEEACWLNLNFRRKIATEKGEIALSLQRSLLVSAHKFDNDRIKGLYQMKYMLLVKLFAAAFVMVFLHGCASASPYNYNGMYYMVGDSSCSQFRSRTSNTINCFDSDGNATGYRVAMTDQDIQMYNAKQAQQDRDLKELRRQNDRQADKNHATFCSSMPAGTYGCN